MSASGGGKDGSDLRDSLMEEAQALRGPLGHTAMRLSFLLMR